MLRREGSWAYYSVVPEALEIARGFLDQVEQSLHVVRAADSCDEPA